MSKKLLKVAFSADSLMTHGIRLVVAGQKSLPNSKVSHLETGPSEAEPGKRHQRSQRRPLAALQQEAGLRAHGVNTLTFSPCDPELIPMSF